MNTSAHPEFQMSIEGPAIQPIEDELEVIQHYLPLVGARVLELGCGAAEKTRQLAEHSQVAEIVAAEVDLQQHHKNLQINDLSKVTFAAFGAEDIEADDASFDIVLMFKSLHHVPIALMHTALEEIHRVLRPGGLLYVSEPVFAGDFNEIIRLFHDEEAVRTAAFNSLEAAVSTGAFTLAAEHHFKNVIKMQSFSQFETGILNVTHTDHSLSPQCLAEVKARFESHRSDQGYIFEVLNRVDLLEKP
ncbi:MAG: methyltransferase domain-containing protein [Pseudomonadales bacterium]